MEQRREHQTRLGHRRLGDCCAYGQLPSEAEAAVAAARYAPQGCRTIGGQLHAINFECDPGTYYARANDEVLVVLMAEHVKAIEKADDIFSVPGIDVVFIGPNDLTHSMGKAPCFECDDEEFTDALAHILQVLRSAALPPEFTWLTKPQHKGGLPKAFNSSLSAAKPG